jgi:hypothetical protein
MLRMVESSMYSYRLLALAKAVDKSTYHVVINLHINIALLHRAPHMAVVKTSGWGILNLVFRMRSKEMF